MSDILQFKDDYRWLSNFWMFQKPMKYQGLSFPTNEHFYVAMKTKDFSIRKQVSEHPLKGVKKFGQSIVIRDDWDDIKLEVMLYGLRYKFSNNNPILRDKLLSTGICNIEEGNWWGDIYWGVNLKTGVGENNLGKLLMKVREEINEQV